MKKLAIILLCCFSLNLSAQSVKETEIPTTVSEVTVYLNGAQITRSKSLDLEKGRGTLKFTNLSPFIDSKSINISARGDLNVLSVNYQQNFLSPENKSKLAEQLTADKLNIEKKINLENTYLNVLSEELAFLKANQVVGGSNTGTNPVSLKEVDAFFTEKMTAIKLKEIERQNTIEQLSKELEKTGNQLRSLSDLRNQPTGEILLNFDAKSTTKASFEIKYIVKNAGWSPSYDIRVKSIDQPANLTYKANIHQNTNEDWSTIKLKLSSADPNSSGSFRDLTTYYLDYNSAPPSYSNLISQVSGRVYNRSDNKPLPGATIMIKGTSIGTVSDANGFYSLSVPQNGGNLVVSFVGMKSQELSIRNQQMDITLSEDRNALNEVVVVGYGAQKSLSGRVGGVAIPKLNREVVAKEDLPKSKLIEAVQIANQTTVEFEIKTPYTIPSNGKNLTVEVENYSLPAIYQYYCAPKVDKGAFLMAQIVDWEKYNLLEGEANIFFEDTYTGKTLLDVRFMSDTLNVSLGKDKSIAVNRLAQKQFTSKQFLGSKKEEIKSWLISVKNNKQQSINLSLIDQIPVSTIEEIEVNPLNISNGKLDPQSGKIKWEFQLKPAAKEDIELKYAVKSPKSKRLIIE